MMQISDPKDQKIAVLEQQLEKASLQLMELSRRISYLERENSRRKQDISHVSQKKG